MQDLSVETQKQFYAPLKELAAAGHASFVDQYAITRAGPKKWRRTTRRTTEGRPVPDGFHTSPRRVAHGPRDPHRAERPGRGQRRHGTRKGDAQAIHCAVTNLKRDGTRFPSTGSTKGCRCP